MRWAAITTPAAGCPAPAIATGIARAGWTAPKVPLSTARRRSPTAVNHSARAFASSSGAERRSWRPWRWRCTRAGCRRATAALRPLIEDDLFHDEPKDLLALDHARRIPQFGKILTQRDNLSAVGRGKRYRLLVAPTLVFNVDLLRLPELVLPYALQRPCHQTVLGFDGIILTARPLRLIARSLALERPLALERAGFVLQLAESGNRESEAI